MTRQQEQFPDQQLLDTDPAVAIDVAIGEELQPGETIEADYSALRSALQAVDAPPDNSDLTIRLRKVPRFTAIGTRGQYTPHNHEINSPWMPWNPEKTQRYLQHELQHTTDPKLEELSSIQRVGLRTSIFSRVLFERTLPFAAIFILPGAAETALDTNNPSLELTQEIAGHPAMGIYALGGIAAILTYYFSKDERNARQAEKISLDSVFAVQK